MFLVRCRFDSDTLFFLSHVPSDAALFYLGSYSRANGNFRGMPYYRNNATYKVHIRENVAFILGTVAYVVFEEGARQLIRPITAPADVFTSFQAPPIRAPSPSYGADNYLAWPSKKPSLGGGTHYVQGNPSSSGHKHGWL